MSSLMLPGTQTGLALHILSLSPSFPPPSPSFSPSLPLTLPHSLSLSLSLFFPLSLPLPHTLTHTHTPLYDRSTSSTDDEMDDHDIGKLLIVTQTAHPAPAATRKHPGGDRTGNFVTRAKMTTDIAKAINDGLYFYEQVLRDVCVCVFQVSSCYFATGFAC